MTQSQPKATERFQIPAQQSQLRAARRRVCDFATAAGFAAGDVERIGLAVGEALANVVQHGYGGGCENPIDIAVSQAVPGGKNGIVIQVTDKGRQVDPDRIRSRDLDDLRPGGLGVHIIQSVMDEVDYARAPDCGMILTMIKLKTT